MFADEDLTADWRRIREWGKDCTLAEDHASENGVDGATDRVMEAPVLFGYEGLYQGRALMGAHL